MEEIFISLEILLKADEYFGIFYIFYSIMNAKNKDKQHAIAIRIF